MKLFPEPLQAQVIEEPFQPGASAASVALFARSNNLQRGTGIGSGASVPRLPAQA